MQQKKNLICPKSSHITKKKQNKTINYSSHPSPTQYRCSSSAGQRVQHQGEDQTSQPGVVCHSDATVAQVSGRRATGHVSRSARRLRTGRLQRWGGGGTGRKRR